MPLLRLYAPLILWVLLGSGLGRVLPPQAPFYLGQILFWLGVPISIVAFLRQADLSGAVWIAPVMAWVAILLGAALAWLWIRGQLRQRQSLDKPELRFEIPTAAMPRRSIAERWSRPSQGSFLLTSMIGNTGYLGYPVILALVGPQYFGWALFYDMLGTTLGAYGLGVMLAARFSRKSANLRRLLQAMVINPALWSFGIGLWARHIPLPQSLEVTLRGLAWSAIALSLVLIGMRLSQLSSWQNLPKASVSLCIKMLIVPLVLGVGLAQLPLETPAQLVMVLQMAMPPAFATLVISEAYDLDQELTVTTLVMGSTGLLAMIPLWLWLFGG